MEWVKIYMQMSRLWYMTLGAATEPTIKKMASFTVGRFQMNYES